jgi:hypothetical protein
MKRFIHFSPGEKLNKTNSKKATSDVGRFEKKEFSRASLRALSLAQDLGDPEYLRH